MIDDKLDYRLLKVKNGKPFFAIINIKVNPSDSENEIIEEYTGEGWTKQGNIESAPLKGYDSWKKAVINGLEFAFSKSNKKWIVKIKKLEGRIGIDTNPTVVGYTAILAFCKQTNLELDFDTSKQIENFAFKSWDNKNHEKIPNFLNLQYEV